MNGVAVSSPTVEVLRQVRAGYAPPSERTVSEFADQEIIVTSGPLAGTHWQTSFAPYQRGILNAFHEPKVEVVVVMGSSQWGKTACAVNIVAYHIAHDPCTILVVEPTVDPMAKDFAKNRLDPLISASPILAAVVSKKRAKDSSNTTLQKTFRGGALSIGGANSASSLASRAVRLLVLDEIDRYPPELPGEGSTIAIAMKRTAAYRRRRRVLMVSSPTLKQAPIDSWFHRGDQRRYHVPCPSCRTMHPFEWKQVRWTDRDPTTARLHCPACDYAITEAERVAILEHGEWRPDKPDRVDTSIVSFHVWEAYAIAIDTPIATPSGWTTMGDIQPGDRVFDDQGEPCHVIRATNVMRDRRCYSVNFSDGSAVIADADHLWAVEDLDGNVSVLKTEAIARSVGYPCGKLRYAVPVTKPLHLPDADLPVDPYVLGAWLGDGETGGARIAAGSLDAEEQASHLRSCGHEVLVRRHYGEGGTAVLQLDPENRSTNSPSGQYIGNPDSLLAKMRALGVIGQKHIPALYLRASAGQRLALLQGLMDTDGYVSGGTSRECSYSTTSTQIAEGLADLLSGLGLKHRRYERQRGKFKKEIRLNFIAPASTPVFRLQRKLERQQRREFARETSLTRRKIVSVEPVPSVAVKCIEVDSASRLYLAGRAMIPTHNSPLSSLEEIVKGFLAAREKQKTGDKAEMHTWQNTTLGEPVDPDKGDGVEPHALLLRRESYTHEVPAGACCLTMGVDVQDHRLETLILAWGPGEESWIVGRENLPGDTSQPEPWAMLDELLETPFVHASGQSLLIHATCIDSAGHRTTMVYDYAFRKAARRVYAIIGRDGQRPIVSSPSPRRWGRDERQVPLYTIGVDAAKALFLSRLGMTEKGPGYVHLPHADWADEELVAQLTSERLVMKWHQGVPEQVWKKMRPRNEALDCAIYAIAALRLLNPKLAVMLAALDEKAARKSAEQATGSRPAPPPVAKPPAPPRSRTGRSSYLSRW